MSQGSDSNDVRGWRRWTASSLLLLAALGAVYAFGTSITAVRTAGPEAVVAESWRLFGLLVFAGIFLLLAVRPRLYPGIWELAIFHKAVTATYLFAFASDAPDATSTAIVDGVLAVVIIVAYLLVRADRNWEGFRSRQSTEEKLVP
ncbi:hypothetical protein [Natrialba asiatica]|uniref:DUF2127 domain-containing protein n=1 Tax=Natrialba asiatica (strain ATCC 700177 / DSM 12278 / JCM 9576 / FERM P-10747 / NBRC 102637 / 172P1) TaxID=29540 RepID=M0B3V9_NATA1|nr:hypothetical protein [Natrialba asiatica]ELZ05227.1 hypothetical protein C481_02877 [Natrialba asiatica DSM 12278]